MEVAAHPISLLVVLQHPVPLKYPVLKLAHIKVFVLKHFLTHAVQLRIDIIASFHHSQLEFILIAMCINIIATVLPTKKESKPKSIDKSILLKAYNNFIALFLVCNIR
jgi:hypothetical protein